MNLLGAIAVVFICGLGFSDLKIECRAVVNYKEFQFRASPNDIETDIAGLFIALPTNWVKED